MSNDDNTKPPVENVPSVLGEVSALASANAPFLFFDNAPVFGYGHGICRIALEAVRQLPTVDGQVGMDRVIVAHLRCNVETLVNLRAAIDGVLSLRGTKPLGELN